MNDTISHATATPGLVAPPQAARNEWPAPGEARQRWAQECLAQIGLSTGGMPTTPEEAFYDRAGASAPFMEFIRQWWRVGFEPGPEGVDFDRARRDAQAQIDARRVDSLARAIFLVAAARGEAPADWLEFLLAQRADPALAERVREASLETRAQGNVDDYFDEARRRALARFERRELGQAMGLAEATEPAPDEPAAEESPPPPARRSRRL